LEVGNSNRFTYKYLKTRNRWK